MSNTTEALRRRIESAGDLQSVVRTMKALAASSIGQYERSVESLADYSRTVELGLGACLRPSGPANDPGRPRAGRAGRRHPRVIGAVVFGSDQGLVGQFNDIVVAHAVGTLAGRSGEFRVWAVGDRVHARLAEAGLRPLQCFTVPNSVRGITPLVGEILFSSERDHGQGGVSELHLVYNQPKPAEIYSPVNRRLLPLDEDWRLARAGQSWPTRNLPQVLCSGDTTLRALIREYLFISLFRACAESLASENASRLAAMERADRNIDELLENLRAAFHCLRQSDIDEELFDLITGVEMLAESG